MAQEDISLKEVALSFHMRLFFYNPFEYEHCITGRTWAVVANPSPDDIAALKKNELVLGMWASCLSKDNKIIVLYKYHQADFGPRRKRNFGQTKERS